MLLSSTAEAMFWTGRYCERMVALARLIQSYERMSLDLPGAEGLDLTPLLPLVGDETMAVHPSRRPLDELIRQLVLDVENPSTIRGSLSRARENLRSGRSVAPPAVWTAVNSLHSRLSDFERQPPAEVLPLLEEVTRVGSEVEGELATSMTRDAAYAFWQLGSYLERSDMLLRGLKTLLPLLVAIEGGKFEDVRWKGILECIGAHAMYRRRHHVRSDLETVLGFILLETSFPRSLAYTLAAIDRELVNLPRSAATRAAVSSSLPDLSGIDTVERFISRAAEWLGRLAEIHQAISTTYFPAGEQQPRATVSVPTLRLAPRGQFESLAR